MGVGLGAAELLPEMLVVQGRCQEVTAGRGTLGVALSLAMSVSEPRTWSGPRQQEGMQPPCYLPNLPSFCVTSLFPLSTAVRFLDLSEKT